MVAVYKIRRSTSHMGGNSGWWLLGEGEPGLLKGVVPGRWISSINNSTSMSIQAAQVKVDG